jgi:hypothetical protein
VASEIEGCELDVAYRELFRGGMEGWLAGGLLVTEIRSDPCYTYRTATRSFLSMCKSLGMLVGACRGGLRFIRGLSGIVTAA